MKNSKKILIIIIITFIFEIIVGYFFISNINIDKYNNWVETSANVINSITSLPAMGVKSPVKINTYVYIEYIDDNNTAYHSELTLKNYDKIFKQNQKINIKYNPENPKEAIYPVYEESVMENKKTNLTIIFIVIISLTFGFGIPKYISQKNREIVSENVTRYLENERDNFKNLRF